MIAGVIAVLILAMRVAGVEFGNNNHSYPLYAKFNNIGSLKVRAPVKVGGVVVGRVATISLSPKSFEPRVEMMINDKYHFAESSSASILTAGLLGEQYIGLTPGFVDEDMGVGMLKPGGTIGDTKSALVLEDLIGKFLYSSNKK